MEFVSGSKQNYIQMMEPKRKINLRYGIREMSFSAD